MGANFEEAVRVVLGHEGGFSDDAHDPGGATNFGISLNLLRSMGEDVNGDGRIDRHDVLSITQSKAIEFYSREWWDKHQYGLINDQHVATKIFDLSVNMGPWQAHIIAQRALLAVGIHVVHDGVLGPITRAALNQADPVSLLAAMRSEAAGAYKLICERNHALRKFLGGWLRRAYDC